MMTFEIPLDAVSRAVRTVALIEYVLADISSKMSDDPNSATEEEQQALVSGLTKLYEILIMRIYPAPSLLAQDVLELKAFIVQIKILADQSDSTRN